MTEVQIILGAGVVTLVLIAIFLAGKASGYRDGYEHGRTYERLSVVTRNAIQKLEIPMRRDA